MTQVASGSLRDATEACRIILWLIKPVLTSEQLIEQTQAGVLVLTDK